MLSLPDSSTCPAARGGAAGPALIQAEGSHWSERRRRVRAVDADWKLRFGETVRHRRRQLGLTLDELATQAAMSKPYLSLIETGKNPARISDAKVRGIARALGFNAAEMMARQYLATIPPELWAPVAKLVKGQALCLGGVPSPAGE